MRRETPAGSLEPRRYRAPRRATPRLSGSRESNLNIAARGRDFDVSSPQLHPILEPRGDDRALEGKLRKALSPLAGHADHDPTRAAPYAITRGLEAPGHKLADSLADRRCRRWRVPADRFGQRRRL